MEPFKKCNESSCPLFGLQPNGEPGCFIGSLLVYPVKRNAPCKRKMNWREKREYLRMQRDLERERDDITTKIYHLQLLIDNCGDE